MQHIVRRCCIVHCNCEMDSLIPIIISKFGAFINENDAIYNEEARHVYVNTDILGISIVESSLSYPCNMKRRVQKE